MSENVEDPWATSNVDEENPWGTPEDAKSGAFIPRPKPTDIKGRLVVMVPRKYDEESKVSEYAQTTYGMGPTQAAWFVDLVVLDGGPFSFTYMGQSEADATKYEEKTWTVDEVPALFPDYKVTWGNVIGVVNKLQKTPRPVAVGRLRAGYTAAEMRKGKTFGDWEAELEAHYANPKKVKEPRATWHFEVTAEAADLAIVSKWYAKARENGFTI